MIKVICEKTLCCYYLSCTPRLANDVCMWATLSRVFFNLDYLCALLRTTWVVQKPNHIKKNFFFLRTYFVLVCRAVQRASCIISLLNARASCVLFFLPHGTSHSQRSYLQTLNTWLFARPSNVVFWLKNNNINNFYTQNDDRNFDVVFLVNDLLFSIEWLFLVGFFLCLACVCSKLFRQ